MLRIDQDILAKGLKPLFGRELSTLQRDGISDVISAYNKYGRDDPRDLAYILATEFHETGKAMQAVIETQTAKDKVRPSVDTAIARLESSWKKGRLSWVKKPYWRKDADGLSWLGRGGPQVTHKFNYVEAEKQTGIPFTKNPDLMLVNENAVPVMVIMMMKGLFTGKGLKDFFTPKVTNWEDARRIINGTEKAAIVAGYAKQIHAAILIAMATTEHTADIAAPPPEAPPPPLTQSKITQAAGGVTIGAAVEVAKNTTEWINQTSTQVNTIAVQANGSLEQVQQTVTTVKTTAGTFSGVVHQILSPPVLIVVGLVVMVLAGVIVYKRWKMKDHYGV